MAFIEKKDPVILNVMLTSKGRELLSTGELTFKYYVIGDSEIDYDFIREINAEVEPDYNSFESNILRAKENNSNIISYIPKNLNGVSGNTIYTITPFPYDIINKTESLGFFGDSGTTFNIDTDHVKQPDGMVYMNGIAGGTTLAIRKAPTYGANLAEPSVGDLLFVKWAFNSNTTGHTINKVNPTPYLMYKITSVAGSLAGDNLSVNVDRNLPNFSGYGLTGKAGALIYYSAITTTPESYTDYSGESVASFFSNYQCNVDTFPFWNMSIAFIEEIAGIQNTDRKFIQYKDRKYGGFVSYIQNQIPVYKKMGIIHYTNKSLSNVYGEEFYLKTPKLQIPTIMWHKSTDAALGITLVPYGSRKTLTGDTKSLETIYYDLADLSGNIVGKVFNELKLFVIEDQELLFALSYKSNRSWTLPNYAVRGSSTPCEPCPAFPTTTTTVAPTTTTTVAPTTTTTLPLSHVYCGTPIEYVSGSMMPYSKIVVLGSGFGEVIFNYNAFLIPNRFIVKYDGNIVIDTGYRGSNDYDLGGDLTKRLKFNNSLTGLIDPEFWLPYPDFINFDDGYPRILGAGNGSASFSKISNDSDAVVSIYAPMLDTTSYAVLNCPYLPTTTTSTSTSTTTQSNSNVYYGSVSGNNAPIVIDNFFTGKIIDITIGYTLNAYCDNDYTGTYNSATTMLEYTINGVDWYLINSVFVEVFAGDPSNAFDSISGSFTIAGVTSLNTVKLRGLADCTPNFTDDNKNGGVDAVITSAISNYGTATVICNNRYLVYCSGNVNTNKVDCI